MNTKPTFPLKRKQTLSDAESFAKTQSKVIGVPEGTIRSLYHTLRALYFVSTPPECKPEEVNSLAKADVQLIVGNILSARKRIKSQ